MITLDVVPPDPPEELSDIGVVLSEAMHRVGEHDGEHLGLELVEEVLGQVDGDDAAVAVSHDCNPASWGLTQKIILKTPEKLRVQHKSQLQVTRFL